MFLHFSNRNHNTSRYVAVYAMMILVAMASSAAMAHAEEGKTVPQHISLNTNTDSIKSFVKFPVNTSLLTKESRMRLDRMAYTIDSLKQLDTLISIDIYGYSSPEGPLRHNEDLARRRARTVGDYLCSNSSSSLEILTIHFGGEDWNRLRENIEADNEVPERRKILGIIDSDSSPEEKKKKLNALGKDTRMYLSRNIFPSLRRAEIIVRWNSHTQLSDTIEFINVETEYIPSQHVASPGDSEISCVEAEKAVEVAPVTADIWQRHYYIKTNLLGWAGLWANIEGEADLAPHLSAAIPVYYSQWNYFTYSVKFRTFSVMPEIRYWTGRNNDGFFVGAHLGMCYYNVALGGDHRYQDHDGKTPALGGGLTVGYRMPLRNQRWKLEFSLGGGVYHLDYDIFENRRNGQLIGRRQRTFYGIDKVTVSICYTFGNRKVSEKGGTR